MGLGKYTIAERKKARRIIDLKMMKGRYNKKIKIINEELTKLVKELSGKYNKFK